MNDGLPQQPETPLGGLLPGYVTRVLAKNGIHTVEAVKRAYPHQLLKMWGMGMFRLKQIETALFPGKSFTPARVYSPVRHINGSSLNGVLSPAIVLVLARGGIMTVTELVAMDSQQLLKIKGLGVHKLREIKRVLLGIGSMAKNDSVNDFG